MRKISKILVILALPFSFMFSSEFNYKNTKQAIDCSTQALNKRMQYDIFTFDGGERKIRINPTLPNACMDLRKHNHRKFKYICSKKFFPISQWRLGRTSDNKLINKNCWVKE